MVPVPLSALQQSRLEMAEDWPWLDQTCHFFRLEAAAGSWTGRTAMSVRSMA